jgi:ribonuclease R
MVTAVETSPAAKVLNFLLLRSMKQAYYSSENLRHFGLASQAYSHFTSPIRRYPDLIVHRLLKAFLHKSKKEAKEAPGTVAEDLAAAALHCSQRERVAVDAERELIRMKQVRFAEKHLGEEHEGTVIGVTAKGAFVELTTVFIEGFVPIDRLGPDFAYNEKLKILRGKRTGRTIRIGDPLYVQIAKTNPHLLQIELEPVTQKLKRPKGAAALHNVRNAKPNFEPVELEQELEEEEEVTEEIDAREMWKPEDFE